MVPLVFQVLLVILQSNSSVCARTPLYVGALFELTDHWWADYTNFFPSIIEHAFEGIRNTSGLLEDYELRLVMKDTKGKNGYAAKVMTDLLQEAPPKVAILGPSLSDELTITGQIAPFYNVMELSYVATTASTADQHLFPTLFSINQVTSALNPLRIKMMQHFRWSRVGTISYQADMTISQMNDFHEMVTDNNLTLVTSAVVTDTSYIKDVIARFKQFDVRIIMGSFRSSSAPAIFCEAYRQGLYGSSFVWILTGPFMYPNWLQKADLDAIECTLEELEDATRNYFTLDYHKVSKSSVPTINGKTAQATIDDLKILNKQTEYKFTSYAGWIYDTAWALALGLNHSISHLDERNITLQEFNYSIDHLECMLNGMKEVEFDGVSGPVSFDESGFRVGETFIQQNRNGTLMDVASFDPRTQQLTWLIPASEIWPDGTVPEDHFTYRERLVPSSGVAYGCIVTTVCGGFILSCIFFVFNMYYRKQRSMKMSSPVMNTIIIVGCILLYTEVMVSALSYRYILSTNMCMLRTWLMSVGFTVLFGALFSKTYRIYLIFRDYRCKKRSIKDYQLIIIVCVMLTIDCIILIPWTAVYPMEESRHVEQAQDTINLNVISSTVYLYCSSIFQGYWFAAIYVYKGLLLAFGLFLAWETRKVNVAELNDSKYIGACIYNVVIMCVFGVPVAHVLPIEQTTLAFVLESCLIIFCTTICLCIIFVPKVHLRNQVHGQFLITRNGSSFNTHTDLHNTVQTEISMKQQSDPSKAPSPVGDSNLQQLKTENESLRMQIAKESIAMAKLRKALLCLTGDIHMYKSGDEYVLFKANAQVDLNGVLEENIDLA